MPFENKGLSGQALSLIMSSWRKSTQKQYTSYIRKWEQYCSRREISNISATIGDEINFLAYLYSDECGYSWVNTARRALSAILPVRQNLTFGSHPLVIRFIKGVFERKPPLPRYKETWDVNIVLTYLSNLGPPTELILKGLTYKVFMLLALLFGQRRQTLHALDINSMQLTSDQCIFTINSMLKTSRIGYHLTPVKLVSFNQDSSLCIVKHLHEYINRTAVLRGNETKLLISCQ